MTKFSFLFFLALTFSSQAQMSHSKAYQSLKPYQLKWIEGDIQGSINQLESLPRSLNDTYNLAYLYWINKQFDKALLTINEFINEQKTGYAYFLKGMIYNSQNQYFIALKSLEKAVEIDDTDPKILLALGKCYFENKKYELAIDAFKDALDENDKLGEAVVFLAKSYIALGDQDRALEELNDQLENVYPEFDYLILMGNLYRNKLKKDKAIEFFKKYLDIYPMGRYSKEAHNNLAALNVTYNPVNPINNISGKYKIRKKEHLKYNVSFGFDIGEVKIDVGSDTVLVDGRKTIYVSYKLKSTTFLIDLVAHYESYIDVNDLNTIRSYLSNAENGYRDQKIYIFDRENEKFISRIVNYHDRFEYVERDLPLNSQDGTSILYFSRGMMANNLSGNIATVISEEFSTTEINIKGDQKEVLNETEQNFYYLEAKANYSGVAGMTGDALGYFTKDGEYVPAIGKLKIIIGSVLVELVDRK